MTDAAERSKAREELDLAWAAMKDRDARTAGLAVPDDQWRPMYVDWSKVAAVYTPMWSDTGSVIVLERESVSSAWCPEAVMMAAKVYDEDEEEAWADMLDAADALWPARTEGDR